MALDLPTFLMARNSGGGKGALKVQVVEELPETGEANILYLVPRQTSETNNVFDEYIWINNDYELIGTTDIDISGKQDKFQFTTMPSATSTNVGQIVQYTGTTNANYTNGYFYICVSDGGDPATYSWVNLQVQDGGGFSEITEDTRIYTLDAGIYNVKGNIKVYYNDTSSSYLSDTHDFMLYVGPKYTTGNLTSTPYIVYISYQNKSYGAGGSDYGSYLAFGISATGGSGKVVKQNFTYLVIDTTSTQIIDGLKTFNQLPQSTKVPTNNYDFVNKKYVDDLVGNINTVLATLTTPSNNGGN